MHQTIKKVTEDIQKFHYNTSISSIMEYVNILNRKGASKQNLDVLVKLLAPLFLIYPKKFGMMYWETKILFI